MRKSFHRGMGDWGDPKGTEAGGERTERLRSSVLPVPAWMQGRIIGSDY
jgi:hypothetical protein